MVAKVINGKEIAEQIQNELKQEMEKLKLKNVVPGLGVVLIGEEPTSQVYVVEFMLT